MGETGEPQGKVGETIGGEETLLEETVKGKRGRREKKRKGKMVGDGGSDNVL